MRSSLTRHPDFSCNAVSALDVQVEQLAGRLVLQYGARGKIGDLQIPTLASSRRADSLWQRTCFEAFMSSTDGESYFEFNFSPSSEWAAYRFDAYRAGMKPVLSVAPTIEVHEQGDRLELQAQIEVRDVFLLRPNALNIGMCAVIEERGGNKSYWALKHASGKPDFHRRETFSLLLDMG